MWEMLTLSGLGVSVVVGLWLWFAGEDFPPASDFAFIEVSNVPVPEGQAFEDALKVYSRLLTDYFILFAYKGRWYLGTRGEQSVKRALQDTFRGGRNIPLEEFPEMQLLHFVSLSLYYAPLLRDTFTGNAILQASMDVDYPPVVVLGREVKGKEYNSLVSQYAVEKPTPQDRRMLKIIEKKAHGQLVSVSIYADPIILPELKTHIPAGYYLNVSPEKIAPEDFVFKRNAMWLSLQEFAHIFTFPSVSSADVEKLVVHNTGETDILGRLPIPFEPPLRIHFERRRKTASLKPKEKIVLGTHLHTGEEVSIPAETLTTHAFIQGQTGSGKSWVLMQIALEWLKDPSRSVILIDPNGSTVERVVERLPDEILKKTYIVDVGKSEKGIPLFSLPPAPSRDLPAPLKKELKRMILSLPNQIGSILQRFLKSVNATMSQHMFREFTDALWLLQAIGEASLENLILFFDPDGTYRERVIKEGLGVLLNAKSRYLRQQGEKIARDFENFNRKWFGEDGTPTSQGMNHLTGLQGYISSLANSPATMHMFNQLHWGVNLEDVFFRGHNLFVILPRGNVEQSLPLAMSLMYNLFRGYTNAKQSLPERERTYTLLAVDEAHNLGQILAPELSQDLAEFRKYHTSLVLATQFLGQFTDKRLREEVINNTNLQVILRMKPQNWKSIATIYGLTSPLELAFARPPHPSTGGAVGIVVVDNGKEWVKFVSPSSYQKFRDFYQQYEELVVK